MILILLLVHCVFGILLIYGHLLYLSNRFDNLFGFTKIVILIELLWFLNDSFWESPLVLRKDASLHIVLRDLLAQGLFKTIGMDVKNQFKRLILVVDPVVYLCHHVIKLHLVRSRKADIWSLGWEISGHFIHALVIDLWYLALPGVTYSLLKELIEVKIVSRKKANRIWLPQIDRLSAKRAHSL